jgi:tetratricopeptide (TPR) repeat protein
LIALPITFKNLNNSSPGSRSRKQFKNLQAMIEKFSLADYQAEYADIHYNIGRVYLAKNDIDSALRKFKTALILQPHLVDARTSLARIYMKKHLYADASREYKLALKDIDALRRP